MRPETIIAALRELTLATFHLTDPNPRTGTRFPDAHRTARLVVALWDKEGPADPAAEFLAHLDRELATCRNPAKREFIARLAGSVRKFQTL